jgi:hypothetical protein
MAANDESSAPFFHDTAPLIFDGVPISPSLLQLPTAEPTATVDPSIFSLPDLEGNTFDFSDADFQSMLQEHTSTLPQLDGNKSNDCSREHGDEIRHEDIQELKNE